MDGPAARQVRLLIALASSTTCGTGPWQEGQTGYTKAGTDAGRREVARSTAQICVALHCVVDDHDAPFARDWQVEKLSKSTLLIEMIEMLRKRPGIGVSELARTLDRSERTIYRWLNELSADLRVPVYCSDGGYYLLTDPTAVELIPEELLALRLSLRSSPFADGSPIRRHAESAWNKIRSMTPGDVLQRSGHLAQHHDVAVTALHTDVPPELLETIEKAVNCHHRLKAVYRSQKSGKIKDYLLDPYALAFRRHSWYLLAHSHEHDSVIQFKLARFESVKETGNTFVRPSDFSVDDYFRLSWEAWGGNGSTRVRVRFSPRVAQMISETRRHWTQVTTPQFDGSLIFEVTVSAVEEIAAWIMGYGREAEVLSPPELRDYIVRQCAGVLEVYGYSKEKPELVSSD